MGTDQLMPKLYRELVNSFNKPNPTVDPNIHYWLLSKLFGVLLISLCVRVIQDYITTKIGEGITLTLRQQLFYHLQRMPLHFLSATQSGEYTALFNNELLGAKDSISNTIPTTIYKVLTVSMSLFMMVRLNWNLGIMAAVLVPVFLLPTYRAGSMLRQYRRRVIDLKADVNNSIGESLSVDGALLYRTYGAEALARQRFDTSSSLVRDAEIKRGLINSSFVHGLQFFVSASTFGIMFFGTSISAGADLDLGSIAAFTGYLRNLYTPLSDLSDVHLRFSVASVCFEKLFSYLDYKPEDMMKGSKCILKGNSRMQPMKDHISFESVSFSYSSKKGSSYEFKEVLHDVSFTVRAKQKIAIVGSNGAGKTTVGLLLAGVYRPSSGTIYLDGVDINVISDESRTEQIAFLSQDTFLLHDTIRNNLMFANDTSTEDQMLSACRKANIHELIESLPLGYDTVVGERAHQLSGLQSRLIQ